MSSEIKTNRKKRTSSSQSAGEPLTDHRKRPRNRTIQSCLNCHTSKRMCDRQKPCGRCVQLGLTGLCVYEVANPSWQRNDMQEDGSPLRQRVAELEGVIRQMKNKPHPRWVGSGANAEIDKWHSRSKSAATESTEGSESYNCGPSLPSPAVQLSVDGAAGEAVTTAPPPLSIVPALSDTTLAGIPRSLINDANPGLTSLSTYYNIPSPFEPLSPALVTPTDKFSPSVGIVGDQQPITTDFDIASIFMAYPDLISADDTGVHHTSKHQVPDHAKVCPTRHYVTLQPEDEHCGCLNEPSSYQAVLELSLRLRKAADLLSRSAYHCMGTPCMLNERISELDAFTTSVLGNVQCPPEISSSLMASSPSSRQTSSYSMASPAFASHHQPWFSVLANPGPSQSELHSLYSTQTLPVMAKNHDENFMSWQGPQRKQTAAMNPC